MDIQRQEDLSIIFEHLLESLGVNRGAMAFKNTADIVYLNQHIQWLWEQFKKE